MSQSIDQSAILDQIAAIVSPRSHEATLGDVTVGERQLLVEATHPEDGQLAGVAIRPDAPLPKQIPDTVTGLIDLSTETDSSVMEKAIGIAALNALSEPDIAWEFGDPMEHVHADVSTITTVGFFRRGFEKFSAADVRVIERDPERIEDVSFEGRVTSFTPAQASDALDGADVCFLTGSTLVYGGLDAILTEVYQSDIFVILIGATASMYPEPLFAAGVDILAGARVDDIASVREGVAAGLCGTDLHDCGLTKVMVSATSESPFSDDIAKTIPQRGEPS